MTSTTNIPGNFQQTPYNDLIKQGINHRGTTRIIWVL